MSIFRFSNAGGFGTYQRYNDFLAGNPTTPVITDFGSMFPLGVVTLSSAQATVEFTNIPQNYTHLQIRYMYQGALELYMYMNGDFTNSNYIRHFLYGNGSSASAGATSIPGYSGYQGAVSSNSYGVGITDILDYTNTNKQRVVRTLMGYDRNGSGDIVLYSGMPKSSTAALTSLRFALGSGGNIAAGSSFALYGIQGA